MATQQAAWEPKYADGGPRKKKRERRRGRFEHNSLGWTVMSGSRIASVNEMIGDLAMHCGYVDGYNYEPAFSIPVSTPAQLLDAMIRADRWVSAAGEGRDG